MADQTPPLITEEQFNSNVKGWTISTRGRMASNVPTGSARSPKSGNNPKSGKPYSDGAQAQKLKKSIGYGIKLEFGAISRVRFTFARHGVFLHYGVGRGYLKQGGSVVRGYITKSKGIKAIRNYGHKEGGINRHSIDWFDTEINTGLNQLADITQQFYGDLAMQKVLNNIDKFLIQKK